MDTIKKEDRLKFVAVVFLGLPLLLGVFVAISGVTPIGYKKIAYNFMAMYVTSGLALVLWTSALLYRFSKKATWWSWLTYYFVYITLFPTLLGISSINMIYASFSSWKIIAPLGAMYVLAAILPFINEKLSKTLHTEIFAPQSCLGRVIAISILSLAPIAGIFGAFLSGLAERNGGVMGYSLIGLVAHFFLVWGTASMAYQAWAHRPWKQAESE